MKLPTEFFVQNREKLKKIMSNNSAVILTSNKAPHKSADSFYNHHYNRSFYYFTGIKQPESLYIIIKKDDKFFEELVLLPYDPVFEKWYGKRLTEDEAKVESKIARITFEKDFMIKINGLSRLNLEKVYLEFSPFNFDYSIEKQISKKINELFPYIKIENCYSEFVKMRVIKESAEIDCIKESIRLTKEAIESAFKNLKPGKYEYQVAADFAYSLALNNSSLGFPTILASGEAATCLHYEELQKKIAEDDLVLFDLGASFNGYSADISRTVPANGKFNEKQKKLYCAVLKVQKEIMNIIKPGIKASEVEAFTCEELGKELVQLGLIKDKSEVRKYYFHHFGHQLGLDTHDISQGDTVFAENMVYTVEPGLYVAEWQMGIRIEDDILVTKDGCINLSKDIIKEVEEIEEFLGGK